MSTFRKIFKIVTANRFSVAGIVFLAASFVILFPQTALAGAADEIMISLANILISLVEMLGGLLTTVIELLIKIANLTNFENEAFVVNAWKILRDLANMFFIIALLFIAIATILRLESYSAQRLLFKLILMAILINFSKSIVGAIVQVAQIFMLFFAESLKSAGGLLVTKILLLQDYLSITKLGETDIDMTGVLGAIVLAIILLLIGLVVIGVILIMLLFRILMLWILIIMSPLVFLLHAVPAGMGYASQWWGTFSKYVISGPVLVFFVWLALFAVSSGENSFDSFKTAYTEEAGQSVGGVVSIAEPDNLLQFLIGIGFLIGGLMAAQQMGVMGAGIASRAVSNIQHYGTAPLRGAQRLGLATLRGTRMAARGLAEASTVPERARVRTDQFKNWAETGKFKVITGLATAQGREQKTLARKESVARRLAGNTAGDIKPRQGIALARAEAFRGMGERSLDEQLQNQGAYHNLNTLEANFTAAKEAKDFVKMKLIASKIIEQGSPNAESRIDEAFNLESIKNDQQLLGDRFILEKKLEQKDQQYVGLLKRSENGEFVPRDEKEMTDKRNSKAVKRNQGEAASDVAALKNDIAKTNINQNILSKIAAYDPENRNMRFNPKALSDLTDTIATAFERRNKGDLSMSADQEKNLGDIYVRAQKALSAEGGYAIDLNDRLHNTSVASSARAKEFTSIAKQGGKEKVIKEKLIDLQSALRLARTGDSRSRQELIKGFQGLFTEYGASAKDAPTHIPNPSTGADFTQQELLTVKMSEVNDKMEKFAKTEADYARAAEGSVEKKKHKTRLEAIISELELESSDLATPDFIAKKKLFEGEKADPKKGATIRGELEITTNSILSIADSTKLDSETRNKQLRELFHNAENNIENIKDIHEKTIGLSKEGESTMNSLNADIRKAQEDLKIGAFVNKDRLIDLAAKIDKARRRYI